MGAIVAVGRQTVRRSLSARLTAVLLAAFVAILLFTGFLDVVMEPAESRPTDLLCCADLLRQPPWQPKQYSLCSLLGRRHTAFLDPADITTSYLHWCGLRVCLHVRVGLLQDIGRGGTEGFE